MNVARTSTAERDAGHSWKRAVRHPSQSHQFTRKGPSMKIDLTGKRAIVTGGIHIGDPVIAVGGHFLHEGQPIKVAEARVARE